MAANLPLLLSSLLFSARYVHCGFHDTRFLPVDQYINSRTDEIINFWGYPSEEHKVQTEDGYILTNFRMPNPGGYPVLMLHGLSVSSDCWFLRNPREDFVFLLWKKGYDVWLWNSRGNMYSKEHVSMNNSDPNFYNFTFHELGIYDTTATIDHILKVTGQKSIITIGHSLGTTNVLVAASLRPEYQSKIKLSILWAQSAFLGHLYVRHWVDVMYSVYVRWINFPDAKDFFVRGTEPVMFKDAACGEGGSLNKFCITTLRELSGPGSNQGNKYSAVKMLNRLPTGTSIWTIRHMIQNIRTGQFQPFNWGPEMNMKQYGVKKVSSYPIVNVTVPTAIYYTCCNDYLSSAKDSEMLRSKLPNVVRFYQIPYKKFNHGDFLWAKDSYRLFYKDVLDLIDKYSGFKKTKRRSLNKTSNKTRSPVPIR